VGAASRAGAGAGAGAAKGRGEKAGGSCAVAVTVTVVVRVSAGGGPAAAAAARGVGGDEGGGEVAHCSPPPPPPPPAGALVPDAPEGCARYNGGDTDSLHGQWVGWARRPHQQNGRVGTYGVQGGLRSDWPCAPAGAGTRAVEELKAPRWPSPSPVDGDEAADVPLWAVGNAGTAARHGWPWDG
jgi:hypothetical protein